VTLHPDALRDRRVLVLGLGAHGGGIGAARALATRHGARVTVSDLRDADALPEARAELADLPLEWELGGHPDRLLDAHEVVVVNPAVPWDAPFLEAARRRGLALTTEVSLALALRPEVPAFAVTGTHGKSTCAALTAWALRGLPGRTLLAGNLGGSLLEAIAGLDREDRLVLELSSFQLEALEAPPGWPAVAGLTNLGADHLDRHGTRAAYAAAKRRLLAFQGPEGLALAPEGAPGAAEWAAAARGRAELVGPAFLADLGLDEAALPCGEPFRRGGLRLAARAAQALGLPPEDLGQALAGFPGLPHRMAELPAPPGVRIVDNGVATHPEATAAPLRDGGCRPPIVLLAGGADKGLDLSGLAAAARGRVARAHLHGAGGRRLAAALAEVGVPHRLHDDARSAFTAALEGLVRGETLLFSPSFASFDEFRNFRERAAAFGAAVERLGARRNSDRESRCEGAAGD